MLQCLYAARLDGSVVDGVIANPVDFMTLLEGAQDILDLPHRSIPRLYQCFTEAAERGKETTGSLYSRNQEAVLQFADVISHIPRNGCQQSHHLLRATFVTWLPPRSRMSWLLEVAYLALPSLRDSQKSLITANTTSFSSNPARTTYGFPLQPAWWSRATKSLQRPLRSLLTKFLQREREPSGGTRF